MIDREIKDNFNDIVIVLLSGFRKQKYCNEKGGGMRPCRFRSLHCIVHIISDDINQRI